MANFSPLPPLPPVTVAPRLELPGANHVRVRITADGGGAINGFRDESDAARPIESIPIYQDARAAFAARYATDALFVPYYWSYGDQCVRLNKGALSELCRIAAGDPDGSRLLFGWAFIDVDNLDHADWPTAWTDDDFRAEAARIRSLHPWACEAGLYFTKHGYRLVRPLAEPADITPESAPYIEARMRALRSALGAAGIAADAACQNWNGYMRVPHGTRGGVQQELYCDMAPMAPFDFGALAPEWKAGQSPAELVALAAAREQAQHARFARVSSVPSSTQPIHGAAQRHLTVNDAFRAISRATREFLEGRAPRGARNARLYAAACDLAGCGVDRALAEGELIDAAEACGLLSDDGPAAVRSTIASAYSRTRTPARALGALSARASRAPSSPVVQRELSIYDEVISDAVADSNPVVDRYESADALYAARLDGKARATMHCGSKQGYFRVMKRMDNGETERVAQMCRNPWACPLCAATEGRRHAKQTNKVRESLRDDEAFYRITFWVEAPAVLAQEDCPEIPAPQAFRAAIPALRGYLRGALSEAGIRCATTILSGQRSHFASDICAIQGHVILVATGDQIMDLHDYLSSHSTPPEAACEGFSEPRFVAAQSAADLVRELSLHPAKWSADYTVWPAAIAANHKIQCWLPTRGHDSWTTRAAGWNDDVVKYTDAGAGIDLDEVEVMVKTANPRIVQKAMAAVAMAWAVARKRATGIATRGITVFRSGARVADMFLIPIAQRLGEAFEQIRGCFDKSILFQCLQRLSVDFI